MNSRIVRINVKVEYDDGLYLSSVYVPPKFRMKRSKKCPFKEMEKDALKWVKRLIES